MIKRVTLRRFKRFEDTVFEIPGTVVLAGPNNAGKTTLLQAIAAWSLALNRWKELNNYHRRGGGYEKAPIARQAFAAVPLRSFDLLWNRREYDRRGAAIEIELVTDGWTLAMQLGADSTEQIHVRPLAVHEPEVVRNATLPVVFVPPMTGLVTEEPVYTRPKVDQLLGQAKPGDVLRNLLVEALNKGEAWADLTESISRLFSCTLMPPDASGPNIIAECGQDSDGTVLDIASAGTSFFRTRFMASCGALRRSSIRN